MSAVKGVRDLSFVVADSYPSASSVSRSAAPREIGLFQVLQNSSGQPGLVKPPIINLINFRTDTLEAWPVTSGDHKNLNNHASYHDSSAKFSQTLRVCTAGLDAVVPAACTTARVKASYRREALYIYKEIRQSRCAHDSIDRNGNCTIPPLSLSWRVTLVVCCGPCELIRAFPKIGDPNIVP